MPWGCGSDWAGWFKEAGSDGKWMVVEVLWVVAVIEGGLERDL
jgi:hypothetical protein